MQNNKTNVFFISDLHIMHESMSVKRGFKNAEECFQYLKKQWNSVCNKHSIIYILGDITMESNKYYHLLDELIGQKYVVLGNHDLRNHIPDMLKHVKGVAGMVKYKKKIFLTHCPIHPRELEFRVLYCIHGHCVDEFTELLTPEGWKSYKNISIGDEVYSYNPNDEKLEIDHVQEIVNYEYSGQMYSIKGKGLSMRVTDQHRVIFSTKSKKYIAEKAFDALNRSTITIFKSFNKDNEGIELSDNMLKLYIWLAADGNITNSNLCRFIFIKQRKVDDIKELLKELKIEYSIYSSKGNTRINFRMPTILENWEIKGLDKKLLSVNRHQTSLIKETYSKSDGNRNLIFTSKKREKDILQHIFIINGYSCKVHERVSGFGINPSYQLSVTDNLIQIMSNVKNRTIVEDVVDETVWCIRNKNQNFIARRDGSVFLTGNCHEDNIDDARYINVSCEQVDYTPKRLEELIPYYAS